jgi:hypothetical protein
MERSERKQAKCGSGQLGYSLEWDYGITPTRAHLQCLKKDMRDYISKLAQVLP